MSGRRRIVIDTDPGTDDVQAICMVLACPEVDVVAITTVNGNVGVDKTTRNALIILQTVGRLDIPVYRGSASSLMGRKSESSFSHGADGLGDVTHQESIDMSLVQSKHAVEALIDIGKQNKGEIELICLGPLTNIALAMRLDPEFSHYYKKCYIMGGNYLGTGNTTPSAEFNFGLDPEAAHIVLCELRCPVVLVAWELCLENSFTWEWYHKIFMAIQSKTIRFLDRVEESVRALYEAQNLGDYLMADQLAMAVLLRPEFVQETICFPVKVILSSECRGMLAVDRRPERGQGNPGWREVTMVTKLDKNAFCDFFIKCMQSHP